MVSDCSPSRRCSVCNIQSLIAQWIFAQDLLAACYPMAVGQNQELHQAMLKAVPWDAAGCWLEAAA